VPANPRLRRQRQVERKWRLGARVVFELLDELDRHFGIEDLGAHEFPPVPMRIVGYAR
jgi:hypothetical protein